MNTNVWIQTFHCQGFLLHTPSSLHCSSLLPFFSFFSLLPPPPVKLAGTFVMLPFGMRFCSAAESFPREGGRWRPACSHVGSGCTEALGPPWGRRLLQLFCKAREWQSRISLTGSHFHSLWYAGMEAMSSQSELDRSLRSKAAALGQPMVQTMALEFEVTDVKLRNCSMTVTFLT